MLLFLNIGHFCCTKSLISCLFLGRVECLIVSLFFSNIISGLSNNCFAVASKCHKNKFSTKFIFLYFSCARHEVVNCYSVLLSVKPVFLNLLGFAEPFCHQKNLAEPLKLQKKVRGTPLATKKTLWVPFRTKKRSLSLYAA
jgi:hypothetical protein